MNANFRECDLGMRELDCGSNLEIVYRVDYKPSLAAHSVQEPLYDLEL